MTARRARLGALLLCVAVLVAACGADGDPEGALDTATSTSSTPPETAPGDTAAPVAGEPPGSTSPSGSVDAPEGLPTDPAAPPTSDRPAPAPPPVATPAGPVGSLAATYLRPSASDRVLIQVLAQDGAAPRAEVPERVRQVLSGLSGKPVSVAAAGLPGGARAWTSDELRSLADTASPASTGEQAVLTLLFLRGGFAENERAVGVAVRGDVAAVFAERVDEAAGMLGNRAAVEDAVTLHEVGHLLGLVDLVVDTGRADPEHPGHSPNRGSVMYYAVESTLLGSVLTGGPPRDFDQADLDELARIRNG